MKKTIGEMQKVDKNKPKKKSSFVFVVDENYSKSINALIEGKKKNLTQR